MDNCKHGRLQVLKKLARRCHWIRLQSSQWSRFCHCRQDLNFGDNRDCSLRVFDESNLSYFNFQLKTRRQRPFLFINKNGSPSITWLLNHQSSSYGSQSTLQSLSCIVMIAVFSFTYKTHATVVEELSLFLSWIRSSSWSPLSPHVVFSSCPDKPHPEIESLDFVRLICYCISRFNKQGHLRVNHISSSAKWVQVEESQKQTEYCCWRRPV